MPAPTKSRAAKPKRAAARPAPKPKPAAKPKPPPGPSLAELLEGALQRAWALRTPSFQTLAVDGLAVRFSSVAAPSPHWHFVTSGLAPGLEVSFRCTRDKEETAPPAWVGPALSFIASQVPSGAVAEGAVLRLDRPVASGPSSIPAVAFCLDPVLGRLSSGDSSMPVLAAVALAPDELRLVYEWSPLALLDVLARLDPLLVTDFDRPSLLSNPRTRGVLEQRVDREGSAVTRFQARVSAVEGQPNQLRWKLSREAVDPVLSLLRGRVGHQRPFSVASATHEVEVLPADAPSVSLAKKKLSLKLSQPAARGLRAVLKPVPGIYAWAELPQLAIEVLS